MMEVNKNVPRETSDGLTGPQIAELAYGWLGTPYHHQAHVQGVGADCIGLVIGLWRSVEGSIPESGPNYSPDWGDASGEELMLSYLNKYLIPEPDIEKAIELPGYVLGMRWKPKLVVKHCLISTGHRRVIHAYNNNNVAEFSLNSWWQAKIACAYRFPSMVD